MSSSDGPAPAPPPPHADLVARARLETAWDHLRRRGGGAGVDGVTVEAFARDAAARLDRLAAALADDAWRPHPAKHLVLPSMPERPLAIPTVEDRVVQRALALGLGPWSEPRLSPSAWAYRRGRGVQAALRRATSLVDDGHRWVLRADIEAFFDRIDRARLLAWLRAGGLEPPTLDLVAAILDAGVEHGGTLEVGTLGVLQGSALSPLLANLYLADLDHAMDLAGASGAFAYLRYADDFLVLGRTEAALDDALDRLADGLEALDLRLSARKTARSHVGAGVEWLGACFDAAGRRPARGMLEGLADAAEAASGDAARLAELHRAWRKSYGRLDAEDVPTVPALAAALADVGGQLAPEELRELAAARVALGDGVTGPAALHADLAGWWSLADAPAALLLDARAAARALAGAPDAALAARLARLAGLPAASLAVLAGPRDGLADALARAQAHGLAAAVPALEVAAPAPLSAPRLPPPEQGDPDAAHAWACTLAGTRRRHLAERVDASGWHHLSDTRRSLTRERVLEHLRGGTRVGVYLCDEDGALRAALLRVRLDRAKAVPPRTGDGPVGALARQRLEALAGLVHDHAVALRRAAARLGVGAVLEAPGRFERCLWVRFEEPVPMRHARGLLVRLEDEVGPPPDAVQRTRLPNADGVAKGRGPWAALPLGVARGGLRSVLLDEHGRALARPLAAWAAVPPVPAKAVRALLFAPERGPLAEAIRRKHAAWAKLPHTAQVLNGCAVLRALAEKAEALGRLEGHERGSLVETLATLPWPERRDALRVVLEPLGEADGRRGRELRERSLYPPACDRLRQRHAFLARQVGCDCRFKGVEGGAYPTPVLHALTVREVAAFAQARRAGKAARQADASSRAPMPAPRPAVSPPAPSAPPPAPPPPEEVPVPEPSAPTPPTDAAADRAPAPPPDGAPDPAEAFAAAADKVRRLRTHIENAQRGLERAEAALDELFERHGVDRIRLPEGWLVRRPGPGQRFVIEL